MILLTHGIGNLNCRHALQALADAGLLAEYWTAASWNPHAAFAPLLPMPLRRQLERRTYPAALRPFIRHHPWREIGRMACSQLGWKYPTRHERGPFCIDAVFTSLDRAVARRLQNPGAIRGVYAFEDGALAAFKAARAHGLPTIYDQPIGYWRAGHAIYEDEAVRQPEWAGTLNGMLDSAEKLARKDAELALADVVITASTFTRRTLELAPDFTAPVHVIPYGSPAPLSDSPIARPPSDRLRVLFVGSLGQRKGLSYLLAAIEELRGAVDFTMLGRKVSDACAPLNVGTARHRWIPTLPHRGVLEEMAAHDVLVFPSLFEGFGLVILEAMAQGLPVITTPQTAGPDLIEDGHDGFIVPMRSARAITEKLNLLIRDRSLLSAMKRAARASAFRRTWVSYQHRLIQVISSVLPA